MKRKKPRTTANARAKTGARKTATPKTTRDTQPQTSREKVRAHRARLREQGMRPITIWVPDIRSPKFVAEARRQCRLANKSPHAAEDQAWVDSMSDWGAD